MEDFYLAKHDDAFSVEFILKELGDRGTHADAERIFLMMKDDVILMNDVYQVTLRRIMNEKFGEMFHLSIKRRDKEPIHDWRDLQEIKNKIIGPECEAIEIYPAESRKVDTANQYHLWAFPDGVRIPIGFNERLVLDPSPGSNSKQRPFNGK
jgi:hypothetical protein